MPALAATLALACETAVAEPAQAQTQAQAAGTTTAHLLAGVRAFREKRFAEALVEFRFVERAPNAPAELAFYLGPTLYELGRYVEALRVLSAEQTGRDPLGDFYLATTLYRLRLYHAARKTFRELHRSAIGPRLRDAAATHASRLDVVLAEPPGKETIAALIAQSQAAIERGDALVGAAFLKEALALTAQNPAGTREPPAMATAVNVALTAARRHLSRGDPVQARPLLQALADGAGTGAREAARLLEGLPK
jgi:tetratricopeptide (TPR) repeat protein